MAFVDDKLNRLKGGVRAAEALGVEFDAILISELSALIHRLEAAEQVIDRLVPCVDHKYRNNEDDPYCENCAGDGWYLNSGVDAYVRGWRKTAGKSA